MGDSKPEKDETLQAFMTRELQIPGPPSTIRVKDFHAFDPMFEDFKLSPVGKVEDEVIHVAIKNYYEEKGFEVRIAQTILGSISLYQNNKMVRTVVLTNYSHFVLPMILVTSALWTHG